MNTISDPMVEPPAAVETPAGQSWATALGDWAARLGDETALTFLDYRESVDGRAVNLSWRELDDRVSAVALALGPFAATGDPARPARAAIVASQSAEYVVAFLGAIRAGLVAVPLFTPALPGHATQLAATLANCTPEVVLTATADEADVVTFLADQAVDPVVLAVDTLAPAPGPHDWPRPAPGDLAYLQYTSGSTRAPAGVMLTHHNVMNNARQGCEALGGVTGGTTSAISWLPLYHDMGLILGLGSPIVGGLPSVIMDPIAFLIKPARWLQALSASPGGISAAPNFAYAYCAARVTEDEKAYLDLSRVLSMVNGAEPVLPATIAKFQKAFGECGLRPEAHRPSYGLAEATVLVAATDMGTLPHHVTFDRDQLAAGRAVPAGPGASSTDLVSCGHGMQQQLRVVDPATRAPLPEGVVGEIQVSGPNVGVGYWQRPEESLATFGRVVGGEQAAERWLSTGDLGVLYGGELYMTGRIKDLVIVDGRNHYPQDVEQTVEAHAAVRPHSTAVFAIPHDDGERAVVLVELAKNADVDLARAGGELRAAVSAEHGLALHDVVFLVPGSVPRTSSGKISRALSRASYLRDGLPERLA